MVTITWAEGTERRFYERRYKVNGVLGEESIFCNLYCHIFLSEEIETTRKVQSDI